MGPLNRRDAELREGTPRPGAEGVVEDRKPALPGDEDTRAPRRPPTVSPSAAEWRELVSDLGSLHLGRQYQPGCGALAVRPRPKVAPRTLLQLAVLGAEGLASHHRCGAN